MSQQNSNIIVSQVEQILEIPAFGDTIELMKWEAFTKWLGSTSVDEREKIHAELAGTLLVQAKFESIIANANYDAETKNNQETEQ